jgi:carboxylesterase
MPKPPLHFNDPSAKQRHWDYERVPTSAMDESVKLISEAKDLLTAVKCPVLIMHSKNDSVVDLAGARYLCERLGSSDKQLVVVERSGHVMTLDSDWEMVAETTHRFITAHLPELHR